MEMWAKGRQHKNYFDSISTCILRKLTLMRQIHDEKVTADGGTWSLAWQDTLTMMMMMII